MLYVIVDLVDVEYIIYSSVKAVTTTNILVYGPFFTFHILHKESEHVMHIGFLSSINSVSKCKNHMYTKLLNQLC